MVSAGLPAMFGSPVCPVASVLLPNTVPSAPAIPEPAKLSFAGRPDEAVDEGSQRALVDLAVDAGLVRLGAAAAPARVADEPDLATGDEQRSPLSP